MFALEDIFCQTYYFCQSVCLETYFVGIYVLSHLEMSALALFRPETCLRDKRRKFRASSDAAEHGVSSGPTLFSIRNIYAKYIKNEKKITRNPKTRNRRIHTIRMDKSTVLKRG